MAIFQIVCLYRTIGAKKKQVFTWDLPNTKKL